MTRVQRLDQRRSIVEIGQLRREVMQRQAGRRHRGLGRRRAFLQRDEGDSADRSQRRQHGERHGPLAIEKHVLAELRIPAQTSPALRPGSAASRRRHTALRTGSAVR